MNNREALEVAKSMKIFLGGRMNGKSQLASIYNEAFIRIIAMAEKAEEVREYCEKSLVHCDELVEKYYENKNQVERLCKCQFMGMSEAYADILDRFFKEADNE